MKRSFDRMDQISASMHRKLAELIQTEVRDPRVGLVTISRTSVSRDLANATVFVTMCSDDPEARRASLTALQSAAGFLRTRLSQAATTRIVPRLIFREDRALQASQRVHSLMTQVAQQRGD